MIVCHTLKDTFFLHIDFVKSQSMKLGNYLNGKSILTVVVVVECICPLLTTLTSMAFFL